MSEPTSDQLTAMWAGAGARIVSAAVKCNGLILSLPRPARHHHILKQMHEKDARNCRPSDQGFLTDTGRFLPRDLALMVAEKANQLKCAPRGRELYSEDLW